jgi:multidrug efflux pump subunit AcrB
MNQVIVVETLVANGTPEEIERLVAIPFERALRQLAGVTEIRSQSTQGICRVELSYASVPSAEALKQVESSALVEWAKFCALATRPVVSINTSAIP